MLLSSSTYFVFLVGIFFLYWPLSRVRALALGLILFANYFFYARWDLTLLALIPVISTVDYCIGLGLQSSKSPFTRRALVTASILMNLGVLAFFKYMPFFLGNWAHWTGRTVPEWTLGLPISLSFYCFQALTYTIDLYRRDIKGTRSYLAHLAAVSFFPTILAGPITRVESLVDQFEKPKQLDPAMGGRALFLIGLGLIKKLMIADYLAGNLVNRVFDFPNLYTGLEVLLAVYAYAFELYYDFSGYTDIAIGSALLLGIKLPANFNRPYAAENVADFWRRWHITLSNWLRDYLYFSLPGKRSKVLPYFSLIVTMVIGGLWHGASWNFVLWGAIHGGGLALVRLWQVWKGNAKATGFWRYLNIFVTFHFVVFAWIFFRAPDFQTASAIIGRIGSHTASLANVSAGLWLVLAIALFFHYVPKKWYEFSLNLYVRAPFYAQAAALLALAIGIQYVGQTGAAPFIYTKF
ncbi:MAG: MBOAT family protein [Bryobacterales bacterium]|nr:MBOAT family protein [Bryobacterales bacterium]MBV9396606.1 MBOAT family protein [Bryobacterales bacterium]